MSNQNDRFTLETSDFVNAGELLTVPEAVVQGSTGTKTRIPHSHAIRPITSGTYEWVKARLKGTDGKKIADYTQAESQPDYSITIKRHDTVVFTITRDNIISLNSGGYRTTPKRECINRYLPASVFVYRDKERWYVEVATQGCMPFYDGIQVAQIDGIWCIVPPTPERALVDNGQAFPGGELATLAISQREGVYNIHKDVARHSPDSPNVRKKYVPKQLSPLSISGLPNTPAVYAIYGGHGDHAYVAYVGNTCHLKTRIQQHLISRDGGISTSTSAVSLNPDHVTEIRWWRKKDFKNPYKRRAAESLAADVLRPVLRTRDLVSNKAKVHRDDPEFRGRIEPLFKGEATGRLILPTFSGALERITELEKRVSTLAKQVDWLLGR